MATTGPFLRSALRTGWIYFVADGAGLVKIGFTTAVDPDVRVRALRTRYGKGLSLLGVIRGTMRGESDLHRRFADYRTRGEWFRMDGECRREIENLLGNQ